MVVGPIISLDDWVPERPPKNPLLRVPSPELPPPPPTTTIDSDGNFINDEPLPAPPPELLRHMRQLSEPENKINTANRRNSFAGSTTKKSLLRASTIENLSPPVLPKRPDQRPFASNKTMTNGGSAPTSASKSTNKSPMKTHKVILNGKFEGVVTAVPNRLSDTRLSLRKRSHNAPAPMLELHKNQNQNHQHQHHHNHHQSNKANLITPPPLKPRMSLAVTDLNSRLINTAPASAATTTTTTMTTGTTMSNGASTPGANKR